MHKKRPFLGVFLCFLSHETAKNCKKFLQKSQKNFVEGIYKRKKLCYNKYCKEF